LATGATPSETNNSSIEAGIDSGHGSRDHHIPQHGEKIDIDHSKKQESEKEPIGTMDPDHKNHGHAIFPKNISKTDEKIDIDSHDHTNHIDHHDLSVAKNGKVHDDHHNHHGHHSTKNSKFSFTDFFPDMARKFVDLVQPNAFPDGWFLNVQFKKSIIDLNWIFPHIQIWCQMPVSRT